MLLLLFCVLFHVYSYNFSVLEEDESVISNLLGYNEGRYFEIRQRDYDMLLSVEIGVNGTDPAFQSRNNGDVILFELYSPSINGKAPPGDIAPIKIAALTTNTTAVYNSYLLSYNLDVDRIETKEHTIEETLYSDETSFKLKIVGLYCNPRSKCQFRIQVQKIRVPWLYILVGCLGFVIICLTCYACCLFCGRQLILKRSTIMWTYTAIMTKDPEEERELEEQPTREREAESHEIGGEADMIID